MEDTEKGERHVSIRFPLDMMDAIRRIAKQHERSFNGEVVWALREYIARQQDNQEQPKP
jgi:hypothetical protein